MKQISTFKLTFVAIVSLAMPAWSQYTPIDPPPAFIDYQGRVLNALGNPVAEGTTENIEMYFRIWNHISNGEIANLEWAEKQIVTVADGNFSVRLGEGDPIDSAAGDNVIDPGNPDPNPPILGVFEIDDGTKRYLGVSVAPNSSTKPLSEIQPRLAFLSVPYAAVAEKARFAEFGPSSGTFVADRIGVGSSEPGSLLEVVGINQLTSSNGSGLFSAGLLTSDHIAIDADDIQSYSDQATPSTLKLNDHGGDVEIGSSGNQTTVEGLFSVFGGGFGGQFKVVDEAASNNAQVIASLDAAFGVGGAQLRFEGDAAKVEIGQNSLGDFVVESSTGSQRFVVQQGGNVGVGTTGPSDKLTVSGGNMRLTSGDVEFTTRSGGSLFAWYDPGLQWQDHTGANRGQMMMWGFYNRIHVSATPGSLSPGVILNNGNTSWSAYSDERLKSDMEPLTGVLDKIEGIRVGGYNMASMEIDPESGVSRIGPNQALRKTKSGKTIKHEIGTIAQDWLKDFPEIVNEPQDENDYYTLAYDRVGIVAIGAVQELNKKLKEQGAQIKARDEKIADLEARLARLEALMSAAE